jgi:purine nucleosidase
MPIRFYGKQDDPFYYGLKPYLYIENPTTTIYNTKGECSMPIKILLDTDIGSDIDDAICLAYLLAQPECELLGITTVSGEAEKRAMLASALCKIAQKQIPIYPGAEEPLLVPQGQIKAPQAKALEKWEHDTRFSHGHAVDFLRQTIHSYPGQVTLLTIGPLTNIALLFRLDPDIPYLL